MTFELNEQQVRTLQMCLRFVRWEAQRALTGVSGLPWYGVKLIDAEVVELQKIFGAEP